MLNGRFYQGVQMALIATSLLLPLPVFADTASATTQTQNEAIQRFSNTLYIIKKTYVSTTEDKDLFDNAIRGMLSSLDPHSAYLDENEVAELKTATSGNFGGLGIEVTLESGVLKVVTPLVDSPAYKAGIKAGDYIIKVGAQAAQGLSLQSAANLMRGPEGSAIDLVILRKGENKPLTFTVIREKIQIKSVQSKLLDGQFGYVRLSQFQESTGKDMKKAIADLKQKTSGKLKGLVLDLRNNPGGLLDSAIEVSDAFINNNKKDKKKIIVYTEGRLPESKFTAIATPGDVLNNAPIIVLINNGSASAAEIVAGALKDHHRAITMGAKSFGKGSVQTVLALDDKHAIKLTTAFYYTPAGISIQAKGITPDIVVNDISIPKSAKINSANFSEAELSGHLDNGNGNDNTRDSANASTPLDSTALLHEDYQLYSALTVLKSLSVNN